MSQSFEVQELLIAIAVKQQNPTFLTADFLKYTGIIPSDWELAKPPVLTNTAAQVIFQNGVSVVAEVNRIIFAEAIANKQPQDVQASAIAQKYITTVKQVNYQGIGVNLRGFVVGDSNNQSTRNYIVNKLLQPGAWQNFGSASMQASLRFVYTLDKTQLFLEVNEAQLQYPDQTTKPAVLFSANFSRAIAPEEPTQRLAAISTVIDNWPADLATLKSLVDTKFFNAEAYAINAASTDTIQFPSMLAE